MRGRRRGCTAFHLAAQVGTWGKREDFERGNVKGTENVLERLPAAGVERFVHCSTEAVLLAGRAARQRRRETRAGPTRAALYSATKARAEEVVERTAATAWSPRSCARASSGAAVTPPCCPRSPSRRARAGCAGSAAVPTGHSTTHVDNTVEGLLLAAEKGDAGEIYFVTDGEPWSSATSSPS